MFFQRIESEGLAHYSYIFGHNGEACVVDPRRDCGIYEEIAAENGYRIKYILETHRNEDYLIGSCELSDMTGAEIWHADSQWDYEYGEPVEDGQEWSVGNFKIKAVLSPGHTPGMMSYLLSEPGGEPWVIFTGDALFAGDVGRVDFMGKDKLPVMAEKLYNTIYEKILPLGDGVIICPAHGAGSVCGSDIADRLWTTVGLEKRLNPKLQLSKKEFIRKVGVELEVPPYFKKMEELNVKGPPVLGRLPFPSPLSPREFKGLKEGKFILDTRMDLEFGQAHISDSLSIWKEGIPNFAGWFIPLDGELLLVEREGDIRKTIRYLVRLGFDRIEGYLSGGMLKWHMAGFRSESIDTVTVTDLCRELDRDHEIFLLDVRSRDEIERNGRIPDAENIHLTQIPENTGQIPRDRSVYIFCGSGLRSMIAASYLKKKGFSGLKVVLGGLAGWSSSTCPIEL